jgi:hypothetical protein
MARPLTGCLALTLTNFLAVLADGRVAVSDPIDERILIFDDGCSGSE